MRFFELPINDQLLLVAFLWSYWNESNRGNHGEQRQSIEQFQFTVRRHVNEWNQYLKKRKNQLYKLKRNGLARL
jgi:hypothetical protein